MKAERKETVYKLIEELEAVIAGVEIQQRLERDEVKREQKEVGWMSAGLVDTGALDALTEDKAMKALKKKGTTCVIVAPYFSLISTKRFATARFFSVQYGLEATPSAPLAA